ncbi:redoxin domain-containing protein [candidate division KSB1 bacterium]|nr:redoxin domain-containing protein [candidate division KSB1 bacterium]
MTVLLLSHPDCGDTTTSMPLLKGMRHKFVSSENINFISRDSSEVLKYHSKFDFQFESIIDNEIWKKYGVIVTPTAFIIDSNGLIRHRKSGAFAYCSN